MPPRPEFDYYFLPDRIQDRGPGQRGWAGDDLNALFDWAEEHRGRRSRRDVMAGCLYASRLAREAHVDVRLRSGSIRVTGLPIYPPDEFHEREPDDVMQEFEAELSRGLAGRRDRRTAWERVRDDED